MAEEDRSGPFEERIEDDEILEFIQSEEVVTTKDVAKQFDYHLQTARRRLKSLEQEGEITMKDVGKRYVWWIPRDDG